ncbi:MAG: ABC transporter substrate-binding protein [Thaumarchaeota archaeon]|nr:ABC transporter substrate-binding protein [Nitrososphaerota archaeon]
MAAGRGARTIRFADRVRPMPLNTGSVPLLACDLGFMSKEGLDSSTSQFDGSPQAIEALKKGVVDMVQVNISPVVEEVAKGAQFRVVWGSLHGNPLKVAPSATPGVGIMLVSSLKLSKIDDLRGAKIGISLKGATNHFAVASLLRKHSIDPETGVRWVEGGTPFERVNKVIDGEIDATWTTSQTLVLFEDKKNAFRILADTKDFTDAGGMAFLVVVTRAELVEDEPQTVLSAVKALVKAAREFSQDQEAWVAGVTKRRPEMSRDSIVWAWQQSRGHWPVNGRLDHDMVEEVVSTLAKSGQVPAVPSTAVRQWVEMRFVDSALKELGEWP